MPQISLKEYQEDRFERGVYDRRNKLNDLTGKEWLFSTKTIIPKVYSSCIPTQAIKPTFRPLPVGLSQELIATFTKPRDTILDPFAGIGSTLIAGYYTNKSNSASERLIKGYYDDSTTLEKFNELIRQLKISNLEKITYEPFSQLKHISNESVGFILSDMLNLRTTKNQLTGTHINFTIEEMILETINKLKISIPKLIENKYLVITIPFWNGSTKTESKKRREWNFAITRLISDQMNVLGMILKAERFWFEPSNSADEITLIEPKRRILVYRKESSLATGISPNSIPTKSKLPLGPTLMLHRSFPPSFEHKLRGQHGGMKPPELIEYLIQRYSKAESDLILDPFAGVGGTLLGSTLTNRKAVGIDINTQWQEVYCEVCRRMQLHEQTYVVGDSSQILNETIEDESVGMIMTDVPYWAMDKLRKTRGRFSKAGEKSRNKLRSSLKQFDQAAFLTIQEWHALLEKVFSDCYPKLIPGNVLAVFIGNMYRTLEEQQVRRKVKVGRFLLLSSSVAELLVSLGYKFLEEIVWYAPDKALHIFGYPYSYIPSVVHQSILIFKK